MPTGRAAHAAAASSAAILRFHTHLPPENRLPQRTQRTQRKSEELQPPNDAGIIGDHFDNSRCPVRWLLQFSVPSVPSVTSVTSVAKCLRKTPRSDHVPIRKRGASIRPIPCA